jgi:hypothetical protein
MKLKFENPPFWARWIMFRRSLDIRCFFRRRIDIDLPKSDYKNALASIAEKDASKTFENKPEK